MRPDIFAAVFFGALALLGAGVVVLVPESVPIVPSVVLLCFNTGFFAGRVQYARQVMDCKAIPAPPQPIEDEA